MQVPLIDLQKQYQSIKPEIDEAIARVLSKGQYVVGEEVEKFEHEWAAYCKAKYCVAVSSGTDALYLALAALSQNDGTLWTTSRTFIAVAEAAERACHRLCFYDTGMPPEWYIQRHAIAVPVSLCGMPHNEQWSQDTRVIEDLAQAHGHPLRGFAAACSFYPTKNLGANGQAGAVVTNDSSFADEVRHLHNHGEEGGRFNSTTLAGGNYRMDELQAAILRTKLPHLDEWNKRRREIAKLYTDYFKATIAYQVDILQRGKGERGITIGGVMEKPLREYIKAPEDHPEHVYHIYAVETPQRDSLASYLWSKGIQTAVRYPIPLHLQPALAHLGYKQGDFPEAERWANETLSLPMYPELEDSQVEYVCKSIREWAGLP